MFVFATRCAGRLAALAAFAALASASSVLWTRPTQQSCTAPALFYVGTDAIVTYGCQDSTMWGVNASTGAEIWSAQLAGQATTDPIVSLTGSVYIASANGQVMALDVRTGNTIWSENVGEGIMQTEPMALCDNVVVVGSDNGNIFALAADTGASLWTDTTSYAHNPNPICSHGVVAFTHRTSIMADDINNEQTVWQTPDFVAAPFSRMMGLGESLYAPNPDGTTYVLAFSTGSVTERLALNTRLPLAASRGAIYATTADGRVEARSQQSHGFLWNSSATQFSSQPVPADSVPVQDVVYVGSSYGVWGLDTTTGTTRDTVQTNTPVTRPPAAHHYRPGVIFFTTQQNLYAAVMSGGGGVSERPMP